MRQAADPQGATRVARGPGKILREAREAAGYSLEEMARRTRLQPRVVEAVEADAYERLAGTGFVKGYIRLMARELHLDPAGPLAEFDLQFSAIEPSISNFESRAPAELTSANRWVKATSIGLVVVLVALVVAWWDRHQRGLPPADGETPTAETQTTPPEPGTPLPYAFTIVEHSSNPLEAPANWRRQSDGSAPPAESTGTTEAPAGDAQAADKPNAAKRAAETPMGATPTETAGRDKPANGKPTQEASAPEKAIAQKPTEQPEAPKPAAAQPGAAKPATEKPTPGAAKPAPENAMPGSPASSKSEAGQTAAVEPPARPAAPVKAPVAGRGEDPAASERPDLVLHAARNESWVEITDRKGEKLWSGTVKRGGRIGVSGKPPYTVVIGNAQDVDVTWRDRPVKLGRTIQNGTARGTIGEPD